MRLIFLTLVLLSMAFPVQSASPMEPVLVAVIDTGIDMANPQFANNLWNNPSEIPDNGLDDDGNGLVDDVHGWNFCKNNGDLSDQEGHGTHVTGIIQKTLKSHSSISQAQFMVLKYNKDCANHQDFVRAVNYALDKGAHIINISGGGFSFSREEAASFRRANGLKVTVVSASGNKSPLSHHRAFFPAAYNFPNIYSVVATDSLGQSLATSNINPQKKNLFAPGEKVLSNLPGNKFGEMTGTSQAAAFITGQLIPIIAGQIAAKKSTKLVSFYSNPLHSW